MSSPKFAIAVDDRIDVISFDPDRDEAGELIPPWFAVDDSVFAGFILVEGEWVSPPVEEPEPQDPSNQSLSLYGAAQLSIINGEVSGLPLVSKFSAAFQMGVGETWVFFSETQADTDYMVLVYPIPGAVGYVLQTNKFEDFFIITVTDYAGNPIDAEFLSLEVKRVG